MIRREVGAHAIVATARELGIDPDVVRSDAHRFEAAASSGDDAGALAIYRGDFLPGFQLDSAREFRIGSTPSGCGSVASRWRARNG